MALIVLAIARPTDTARITAALADPHPIATSTLTTDTLLAIITEAPPSLTPGWLRHASALIAHLHEHATIIPGCLSTPLATTDEADRSLRLRAHILTDIFPRIDGCDQWSIRLPAIDPSAASTQPPGSTAPSATTPTGTAYLHRLRQHLSAESAGLRAAQLALTTTLAPLAALAHSHRAEAPTPLVNHPRVHLLVPRTLRDQLRVTCAALNAGTLSGPFAPFDFSNSQTPAAILEPAA